MGTFGTWSSSTTNVLTLLKLAHKHSHFTACRKQDMTTRKQDMTVNRGSRMASLLRWSMKNIISRYDDGVGDDGVGTEFKRFDGVGDSVVGHPGLSGHFHLRRTENLLFLETLQ